MIIADAAVAPGKCVLETPLGSTVIDPLSEIDEIEAAFAAVPRDTAPKPDPELLQ